MAGPGHGQPSVVEVTVMTVAVVVMGHGRTTTPTDENTSNVMMLGKLDVKRGDGTAAIVPCSLAGRSCYNLLVSSIFWIPSYQVKFRMSVRFWCTYEENREKRTDGPYAVSTS